MTCTSKKTRQRETRLRLIRLLDRHCRNCPHRPETGLNSHCARECSVGKRMLELGERLKGDAAG